MSPMIRSKGTTRHWTRSVLVAICAGLAGWYAFAAPGRAAPPADPVSAAAPTAASTAAPRWDAATFHKPSEAELKSRLSPLQFEVTQEAATEPSFHNLYWDNHRAGIYVDVVSGEPLFSSLDKYDSGTGWPSFSKPLDPANVKTKTDFKLILPRHEVRSVHADSHLGHVFNDGPPPTGQRYCMNSAALRFVPVDRLQAEGYGQYLALFQASPATAPSAADSATVKPAAAAH